MARCNMNESSTTMPWRGYGTKRSRHIDSSEIASYNDVLLFCENPKGIQARHGHYVELLKCLYGTKNAAREFFVHITKGVLAHGLVQCPYHGTVVFECVHRVANPHAEYLLTAIGLPIIHYFAILRLNSKNCSDPSKNL